MRHGDPGVGRRGDARGHARDHLERDVRGAQGLGLLAAAAEYERIPTLEADHRLAGDARARRAAHRSPPARPTDRRPPCPRKAAGRRHERPSSAAAGDQPVVDDHVGGGDQLERPSGHQPGIAGPGADQVDGHTTLASRSARRSSSPAPALSSRCASALPRPPASPIWRSLNPCRSVGQPHPRDQLEPAPRRAGARARRPACCRRRRGRRRARARPSRTRSPPDPRPPPSSIGRAALRHAPRSPALPDRPRARAQSSTPPASSARPSRSSPASASTIASNWPSASLRSRVSTLPRTLVTSRSSRTARI